MAYTVKRSERARTWRLEVGAGTGLCIIVPQAFDARRIPAILQARRRWILKTLDWAATQPPPLAHDGYAHGQTLPYRGQPHALNIREQSARPISVTRVDHTLVVSVRRRDGTLIRRALRRWYTQQATAVISQRAADLATRLKLCYRQITIGDQRTRWGSCSRSGRLRFNWRLVLMPPAILDYVIIHELTHLKALNHSKHFWRLVAAACPDYHTHRTWLRKHGPRLYI